MITILKQNATKQQRDNLIKWFEGQGLKVHISEGEYQTVLGLVGDTSQVDEGLVEALDIVERVTRVTESYKAANIKFHPEQTVVSIGDVKIGGGHFAMIAGPCSVESESQILEIAKSVKGSGASLLRGGAFKPRTRAIGRRTKNIHALGDKVRVKVKSVNLEDSEINFTLL